MNESAGEITEGDEEKEGFTSFLTTILAALFIAFLLRIFIFQPFTIPSPSMEPNLIEGDYIITSKYSVGYGRFAADPLPFPVKKGRLFEREPKRGDIIVFKPEGIRKHYIKRLVGLPGDRIQMIGGVLYINEQPSPQTKSNLPSPEGVESNSAIVKIETIPDQHTHMIFDIIEQRGDGNPDNTGVYLVPDGHYFMLGDNRDNSGDSRFKRPRGIGFVPAENIIGKAEFILLSAKKEFSIIKPWTWGKLRGNRFFKGLR